MEPGVLIGNLWSMGSYRECVSIEATLISLDMSKLDLIGKYCHLSIKAQGASLTSVSVSHNVATPYTWMQIHFCIFSFLISRKWHSTGASACRACAQSTTCSRCSTTVHYRLPFSWRNWLNHTSAMQVSRAAFRACRSQGGRDGARPAHSLSQRLASEARYEGWVHRPNFRARPHSSSHRSYVQIRSSELFNYQFNKYTILFLILAHIDILPVKLFY